MNGDEKRLLIDLLGAVNPTQPYGTELFDALARVTVSIAIEAVCLRRNAATKQIEVLMIQRPMDDTAYPGMWHCPGSVLRPGEEFKDVFNRLERQELGGSTFHNRNFIAPLNILNEARGHFISLVYRCDITEMESSKGIWFMVTDLPADTVPSHRNAIIPIARETFIG